MSRAFGFGDFEQVDSYGNVIGLNPNGTIPGPVPDAVIGETVAPVTSLMDSSTLTMLLLVGLGIYLLMGGRK